MEINGGPDVAPFVITYRQVFQRPKIEITRKFVGIKRLVVNAIKKAQEVFDEIAYDVERNVVDPGKSRAVHWAINVREPWESGSEADVVAVQVPGIRPPAGYHFEVIQVVERPQREPPRNGTHYKPPGGVADHIRSSMLDNMETFTQQDDE
jgi:hypothetical protein